MTSLSAVVSITVVLLGGPQGLGPFTAEGPYAGRLAAPPGYGFPLQGDRTMHDSAAGLTTIVGPDEATLKALFGEGVRSTIIEPTIEGGLYTWPESQFEFLWPKERPQYYLEKLPGLYLGYSVYGRIELVDKEGYTVSVQPAGQPDALTVQVEFANKTLSGGKYDETIRAFVGRPTLIKAIVTATAPLTKDQKTLLVWRPSSARAPAGGGGSLGGPLGGLGAADLKAIEIEADTAKMAEEQARHVQKLLEVIQRKASEEQSKAIEQYAGEGLEAQRKALEALLGARDLRLRGLFRGIPAQSAPTLRVLDSGAQPMGVAVLLEVTPSRED